MTLFTLHSFHELYNYENKMHVSGARRNLQRGRPKLLLEGSKTAESVANWLGQNRMVAFWVLYEFQRLWNRNYKQSSPDFSKFEVEVFLVLKGWRFWFVFLRPEWKLAASFLSYAYKAKRSC